MTQVLRLDLKNAPFYFNCSLRSKRSCTKRMKFGQRVLVFRIRDARKMGREQKGGRKGVGEEKEGTLARKPLDFEKPICPRTGLLIGAAWSSLLTNVSSSLE